MNELNQFRLILFFGVLGIMFLCESFWSVRRWEDKRARRWLFHGGLSIFNTVVTRLVALVPILALIQFVGEQHWGLARLLGLSGWAEILATVIIFDAFDYWWHRLNHEIPFLWRFHRAHHLDTHVDVTTSLRFHPIELLLSNGVKATWILAWGPSLAAFIIFEAGITAYSQFHHSAVDLPSPVERVIRWVHMTPRLHAGHHTVTLRTRNANYSTIFLIWDRLFGTLRKPRDEELKALGLAEGRDTHLSMKALLTAPFTSMSG